MFGGIISIILYSIVVNVEDHLPDLVIWKRTDETALVVLQLQRGKGVYPYDRFEETVLSSQDSFFSKLSGSPSSNSEYTHATRVWNAFGRQTIAAYHDTYL